jgi:hypothetical protein
MKIQPIMGVFSVGWGFWKAVAQVVLRAASHSGSEPKHKTMLYVQ